MGVVQLLVSLSHTGVVKFVLGIQGKWPMTLIDHALFTKLCRSCFWIYLDFERRVRKLVIINWIQIQLFTESDTEEDGRQQQAESPVHACEEVSRACGASHDRQRGRGSPDEVYTWCCQGTGWNLWWSSWRRQQGHETAAGTLNTTV